MKHFIYLFLVFCLSTQAQQSKKTKVLFIGNSYTYVNNLPQLVHDIALANGDTLVFDSYCPGGYTFFNHANDANTYLKILSNKWDFVVLQAQSQEPSFSPAQVSTQTLPYLIALDTMIKNHLPCAKTVLYETWGRKFGDAANCANYPPICTYTGMQNRLKQSYKLFADTSHGIMAPVGEAFRKSILLNPNLELYQADQSHPSLEGSYLGACVFYESLFQKSVLSNTFNPGIATATLSFLKQTAHQVVQDSLLVWNFGINYPLASFTYSQLTNSMVQFDATYPWLNHTWYFGDGSSNLGPSLQHQYSVAGQKTVSHVVDDGCKKDSSSIQLNITIPTDIFSYLNEENTYKLYPNPTHTELYIEGNHKELMWIEVYDIMGLKVMEFNNTLNINLKDLKSGLYLFVLHEPKNTYTKTIIKTDY